jgi:hypothetical protein
MSGGAWTLHFDWNCTGNYDEAQMMLNGDGTFTVQPSETGKWVINEGKIMFRFDTGPAVYSGDIIGLAMVGISSTFQGLNGCWYALTGGATAMALEPHKTEYNVAGKKVNSP